MISQSQIPDESISLFVKNVLIIEGGEPDEKTVLPFFADGYPGLMFQETENGLLVNPHNKKMPLLFIYGQTIKPIELVIDGKFKLIVFQLYPFVLKNFFNLDAKDLNDTCYDLQQISFGNESLVQLDKSNDAQERIEILTALLLSLFRHKKQNLDLQIRQAIQLILDNKGRISIRKICDDLHITERTFERRFLKETGISAKQFSVIIQFQHSYEQITKKDFSKLSDVVYENGYADQSHFIKVFKAFTGKTPKQFK